jgi:hypothetical protein
MCCPICVNVREAIDFQTLKDLAESGGGGEETQVGDKAEGLVERIRSVSIEIESETNVTGGMIEKGGFWGFRSGDNGELKIEKNGENSDVAQRPKVISKID